MRAIVQRVTSASVTVDNKTVGQIEKGLLIFLCVCKDDTEEDISYMARKIINMRIFPDENGKFNLSLLDIEGSLLVISQFTLAADTKKGNRPSYFYAAQPKKAEEFYLKFIYECRNKYKINTQSGVFAAHMNVNLTNDGPVTIYIDSKINRQ